MDKAKDNAFDTVTLADGDLMPVMTDEAAGRDREAAQEDPMDFQCSLAQERFWLLDRLDPGNPSYNVAVRWKLEGTVSTALLERAWLTIIERHEVLRTVFFEVDGVPRQRVQPRSNFKLAEIDLGSLPDEARQAEGDRIGMIEARAPFDVTTGPLVRATLLRYEPTVSIILVTTHQIVSDGWSIGIMAREMGEIYRALSAGVPVALEEIPLQYADYSTWQLEWLKARGTEAETAYWTKQLAGIKPFSVLPDHPRPAVPTTNGAIASIVLPRELTNAAQTLSASRGATLFATALSSLTAMLSRYSGETEIVLGTQVSDRDQVELEGMVGQFVNSLILRNDLSGDPRFGELIERCRETGNQALEHRHIPIERLLSMVKATRDSAHSALISVNFIFQRTFITNADYGDFVLVDLPSLPAGAIYDLNFFMVERPDGWRFSCQYNTDQFDGEAVYRLLNYVQRIMACAIENPELRLSQLKLMAPDEIQRLVGNLRDTRAEYPDQDGIGSVFEAQVERTPGSIAIVAGDQQLSYRQVDQEANRLARYLQARGVGAGQRVGICIERAERLPIAMLGVVKTGAAFVILDGADPAARLALLIESAGVSVIVTSEARRRNLPSSKLTIIDLDADRAAIARTGHEPAGVMIKPDSEACTVFVACGQARPGGLILSHRALLARLWSLRERPGLSSADTFVAITAAAIDLALFELLLPLLTGARLVVASAREVEDSHRLLQLLQRTQANVMHGVPSVWNALIDAEWNGQPRLRVLCSGEGRDRRLAGQLLDRSSELWSLYSCSEATICAAAHRILPQDDIVPIGQPLANTRIYVLDRDRQPLPTGAPGELYIGGETLPLGYLDSSATQSRYVPDPFSDSPGARLVRTGDLGRARHNGEVESLGRSDLRVIFNGYRIEPREIETVLKRHPNVSDAAVAIVREAPGKTTITAFIAALPSGMSRADELIEALRASVEESLPMSARPGKYVVLEALPRLADGSVDRRSLRVPAAIPHGRPVHQAPLTANEQRLRAIWQAMLGRDDFDIDANFFELGGHSLLAARMLGRVEAAFGRRISLAALFRSGTIRELASLLERSDVRDYDFRQVVKLQAVGSRQTLIGINNTGIYYMLAKRLGPDQPFTSLQLFDPSVRTADLPKTLEAIAAGYVQLIRRVQPVGPYNLMGWCVAGALAFEIARQLDEQNAGLARVYLMDSWVPNYMARLPKLRSTIAQYSLRWQFIRADWRKTQRRKKGVLAFFENRSIVQNLIRLLGLDKKAEATDRDQREVTPEDYDQWLLGYLQTLTGRYEPRPYRGRLTLFRSKREPTGWWFDPHAGWGPFAKGGIDLHMVDGDHFTMFQEPGVTQMAQQITELVERQSA